MSEYVYPEDVLPEIKYAKRPKNTCGSCCNGIVTNAGAVSPGYRCLFIEYLFKKRGIANGNPQVSKGWGTCQFHGIQLESIKELQDVLFKKD